VCSSDLFVGYDTDAEYIAQAKRRVESERTQRMRRGAAAGGDPRDFRERALRAGIAARDFAKSALAECGFSDIEENVKLPHGVDVSFVARGATGQRWFFDVAGGFTSNRPGLRRSDTLMKTLGKAAVLHHAQPETPFVVLTADLPTANSAPKAALAAVLGPGRAVHDVIVLSDAADIERLRALAR